MTASARIDPSRLQLARTTAADVGEQLAFAERNREFLLPFEPRRAQHDTEHQRRARAIAKLDDPSSVDWVVRLDGAIVARIALSNVSRGAWQNATVGYSVDAAWNGRGIATFAVRRVRDLAFGELGLHRIEAGTLVDNIGSQRVLEHAGFERIGISRHHLQINGEWRDHVLYSCTIEMSEGSPST